MKRTPAIKEICESCKQLRVLVVTAASIDHLCAKCLRAEVGE